MSPTPTKPATTADADFDGLVSLIRRARLDESDTEEAGKHGGKVAQDPAKLAEAYEAIKDLELDVGKLTMQLRKAEERVKQLESQDELTTNIAKARQFREMNPKLKDFEAKKIWELDRKLTDAINKAKALEDKVKDRELDVGKLTMQLRKSEERAKQLESQDELIASIEKVKKLELEAQESRQLEAQKICKLESELTNALNENKALEFQLSEPRPDTAAETRIEELEKKLAKVSSDSQHNRELANYRLMQLNAKTEQTKKAATEAEFMRGAAHAVQPNANTKLPHTVLPCHSCNHDNRVCDRRSKCYNCENRGIKCHRWRCSRYHRYGHCPDGELCPMKHSAEGWLCSDQPRPEY